MAENKNEVANKEETSLTFSDVLTNSLVEKSEGLPKDFNVTRFVQNSIALLNENEQLSGFASKYGVGQIKTGLLRGAFLGLDFMTKECYLIPYGSKLNFMVDYKGATKLCKKYSIRPIKDIFAKVVRAGDKYEEKVVDGKQSYIFEPQPFNDGAIIGAFAVALFEDGGILVDSMSKKEIETTRKHSKASNSMAWTDFYAEMAKKTILRRLTKHIEIDFDTLEQRKLFEEDTAIETENTFDEAPDVIDVVDIENEGE